MARTATRTAAATMRALGSTSATCSTAPWCREGFDTLFHRFGGFPKIGGVPFLGVPLRGFYSIWGITGVPLFWEINHFCWAWA